MKRWKYQAANPVCDQTPHNWNKQRATNKEYPWAHDRVPCKMLFWFAKKNPKVEKIFLFVMTNRFCVMISCLISKNNKNWIYILKWIYSQCAHWSNRNSRKSHTNQRSRRDSRPKIVLQQSHRIHNNKSQIQVSVDETLCKGIWWSMGGKKLFMTFVLPILEYAAQIWSPHQKGQIKSIESVQKQFLLFALRKFKWRDRFRLPSYKHRLLLLHMISLEDRRTISQLSFIHSVLIANISSPSVLNRIHFNIPQRRTRNMILLKTTFQNDPINIMIRKYNEYVNLLDFNQSKMTVKSNLKSYFLSIV